MNIPRTVDNSCELHPTVSTLHIPSSNTFIPFQQFSLSDGTTIRNPADDNNNKTVVSVVATVTGLCPAVSMVSMQQPAQLAQAIVGPNIIPAVVAPIAVQAANCLTPTTTMTVSNAINITSRLSIPTNHQQALVNSGHQQTLVNSGHQQTLVNSGINISHQTGSIINNNIINHNILTTSCPQTPQGLAGIISTAPNSASNCIKMTHSPSVTSTNNVPAKPSVSSNTNSSGKSSNSASPKVSSTTSNQSTSSEQTDDLVKPVFKDGELVLEVECGQNKAILYLSKLCQGSKGPCINFQSSWLTPNEFQFVSGRETAKDWKRSIRHHGKSLKLLLAKGILNVHPTMCDCDGCRQGATLTRKGEKRRIPNGERKMKKPSSNCSNAEGSGVRPGTAPLVAAHLGVPGMAQVKPELAQVRPELKRPLGDMLKHGDAVAQSRLAEASSNSQRQNHSRETPAAHGADGQLTPKDFPKEKAGSLSTTRSPQTQIGSASSVSVSSTAAVPPACPPSGLVSSSAAISAVSPSTSSRLASHIEVPTHEAPKTVVIATPLLPQGAFRATVEDTIAGPTLSVPELHIKHSTINPALLQILSPNLPDVKEAQTPTPTTYEFIELPDQPSEIGHNYKSDSGLSDDDEDINVGNDTDESFNTDSKYDTPDDDSDDECPEYSNKMSEDDDSICDTHTAASPGPLVDTTDATVEQKAYSNSFYSGLAVNEQKQVADTKDNIHGIKSNVERPEHSRELKKHTDTPEYGASLKTATPVSTINGMYDSFRHTETASLQTTCSTTLAISTVSSACSKPISLSISTSNVKSEHVWIPPTLSSSSSECHSIDRGQQDQGSTGNSRSPNIQTQQENLHREDGYNVTSNEENIQDTSSQKVEQSLECGESALRAGNSENCVTNAFSPYRDCHQDDRQLTQNVKDPKSDVVSTETNAHAQVQGNHCRSESTSDKRNKDRDREERHKLRLKEDKMRKEREERSKKGRDRDERRDRERREEKETERLREEERERKVQSESKSTKDITAASPTSDQSRRPTGGVAEAAAFSDYMRFLAAGHGHSFMSPTPGYMCSFFPVQPQESALAPHLVHPLSSFSPQLGHLHKDPLLYQTSPTALVNFAGPSFGHSPPVFHRPQYTAQQSLLDYQRSLAAASSYPWAATYPYFVQTSSSSAAAAANVAAGAKRSSTELEASMELSAKRMRLDGRFSDYTSPWDYFAAAAAADYQHLRVPTMAPSLPCGLESANMDKTAEYLRKRYLEYGPQAAMYLSALPEYSRPAYQCACADHREEDIRMWSVDDVCKFLSSIDGCGMYVEYFREQRVNGRILSMLTSDHLVSTMGMKLGSAVLLSEAVAKKLQEASKMSHCEACRSIAFSVPMHPMVLPL